MTEVVSIKFRNKGKAYFFSPNGLQVRSGDSVIVETAKGLEFADCSRGNHMVEDTAVVQPLRAVVRIATEADKRTDLYNRNREKEALQICRKKVAEHGLDMKLVSAEISFDGAKTTFFFISDGRVDFRDLVKDLAGVFHNRIELRQIGVRDEAKMLGGIGICGHPYCCSRFMNDFQPVSTKMAKVQGLSLNPTKISGSCGRLMCCLRYEQEAYEDLTRKVPKQGAFVETIDGFGTAVQVNLLRQTVKVRLDKGGDDGLHEYKANELCAVPGGRPRDGEEPPHVLVYVPEEPEKVEAPEDEWAVPVAVSAPAAAPAEAEPKPEAGEGRREGRNRRRRRGSGEKRENTEAAEKTGEKPARKPEKVAVKSHPAGEKGEKSEKNKNGKNPTRNVAAHAAKPAGESTGAENAEKKSGSGNHRNRRRHHRPGGGAKPSQEG